MNGVLGMAQVLNDTPMSQTQKEYVDAILLSGRNLMSILNDVLDYSKVEAGALELQPQAVNLGAVLDEVMRLVAPAAQRKGVVTRLDYPPPLPRTVEADPVRLRQVLLNLAGNAVKFTDRGTVTVRVRHEPEHPFVIEFEDTGVGIPAEVLPRLFTSFTQADGSTSRQYGDASKLHSSSGFAGARMRGSEHNDVFESREGRVRTVTNRSGGTQGGISNGEEIVFRVAFKPTATILQRQATVDVTGASTELMGRGRHDPCVVPRAVPIVEAMAALVLLDHWMRHAAQNQTFRF
jgi:hypothetical protein